VKHEKRKIQFSDWRFTFWEFILAVSKWKFILQGFPIGYSFLNVERFKIYLLMLYFKQHFILFKDIRLSTTLAEYMGCLGYLKIALNK